MFMDAIGWVSGNCRFAKPQRTKFYHASPRRFKVGDVLSPRGDSPGIFLTTDPVPHYTILEDVEASKSPWYVYEVEPLGDVVPGFWDDLIASRVKILRFVGNAQGMVNRTKKRFRDKSYDEEYLAKNFPKFPKQPGSAVNLKDVKPHSGVKVRGRGRWNGTRWEPLPTAAKPNPIGKPNFPWESQKPEWK
jgi:hypothetical protein